MVRLHVNVDHVATLRQARGTSFPDPVDAAVICERSGANGITVHLREDRRHIQDRDVSVLRETVETKLNLEMAVTDEMLEIAERLRPDLVTLVPERREERTTEGGLDVLGQRDRVADAIARLGAAAIPVSLFIAADLGTVRAAAELGAHGIELHTGDYAHAGGPAALRELARLAEAARYANEVAPSMILAAGHGLTRQNVPALIRSVPGLAELNIGHALVADAVFVGLAAAVRGFLDAIRAAGATP